jgi:hypothetical protein
MDRLAGRDLAAMLVLEGIALGVDEMAFDVPEPIGTAIAAALDLPAMDGLARRGGGKRHG